jgi:hypothetical protein
MGWLLLLPFLILAVVPPRWGLPLRLGVIILLAAVVTVPGLALGEGGEPLIPAYGYLEIPLPNPLMDTVSPSILGILGGVVGVLSALLVWVFRKLFGRKQGDAG